MISWAFPWVSWGFLGSPKCVTEHFPAVPEGISAVLKEVSGYVEVFPGLICPNGFFKWVPVFCLLSKLLLGGVQGIYGGPVFLEVAQYCRFPCDKSENRSILLFLVWKWLEVANLGLSVHLSFPFIDSPTSAGLFFVNITVRRSIKIRSINTLTEALINTPRSSL